jgi:putative sigma-54 modulation protein
MQVNITARHLRLTSAIADYVQKKVEKANRYFDHLIWAQVILDVEKDRHICEIVIHASGRTFTATEESADLYAAIDLATDKIDAQVRRYKERLKVRRPERRSRSVSQGWDKGLAPGPVLEEEPSHRVSSVRVMRLVSQSLPEAISAMEQSDNAHWIFLNKQNERVTVVYRKPDRTYGVVEATA